MEDRTDVQLEMLAKIHDQLVDLKRVVIEIELARPGASHSLQARLQQIVSSDQHISEKSGTSEPRQQKVIAPTDPNIQTGEGRTE